MPTTKTRINITPNETLLLAIQKLAERDQTSLSSTSVSLIQKAMEIEEDEILDSIAKERLDWEFVSHESAWS